MFISGAKCPTPPRGHGCEQNKEATRGAEKTCQVGSQVGTRAMIAKQLKKRASAGDKGITQKVERNRTFKSLSDLSQGLSRSRYGCTGVATP